MTPIGTRFARRLTATELGWIEQTVKRDGSAAGFHALWSVLLGMAWDEVVANAKHAVNVRDYAIPADQDRLVQSMLSVSPSKVSRKRWSRHSTAMHFLFYGPATWESTVTLVGGTKLHNVHPPVDCDGRACCVHNPSDHHMREWPQNFRYDRYLMERVCSHGVGHPDPDDPNPNRVHGCDGCHQ